MARSLTGKVALVTGAAKGIGWSFTTTYSYTKMGQVDDPRGLKAALGAGNVDVTFESTGDVKHHHGEDLHHR
jgi:NAD(P)-dependent dehydrogenase (short-subunit alcohol dehydrogenase family)